jgi:penicillin-binding protein 2
MGIQKPKTVLKHSLNIYLAIIIFIFAVIFIRLAWLQLIQTEIYQTKAVSNTMRWIPVEAPRGEILANDGQVLVTNRPVFNISLNYLGLKDQDIDKVIQNLVVILNDPEITVESIKALLKGQNRLYEPIVIKRDASMEVVTAIEERRRELPGVSVDAHPQRSYPFGSLAGHLLGYVHSIKEEIEQPGYEDYGMNDLVGKIGIEKMYEHYLNGKKGYRQVEVTSLNRPVREVREIPPIPGHKLVLTLNLKLQQAMEKSFDEVMLEVQKKYPKAKAGAAVLLDVKTSKVLAMVSRPSLNPDDFNGKPLSQDQADYYFRITPPALSNRAIQGSYVPGSVFKPIVGMAALSAAHISPTEQVLCTGQYWNPPRIKCTGVHGRLNYYQAIAKSCNVYFQEMARRAGIEAIGQVGLEFGLGERTGIDLPFESKGILPHVGWQEEEFASRRESINKRFDNKVEALNDEYQGKIAAAVTDEEKKQLERELKNKKASLEAQRRIEVEFNTSWHDFDTYNTGIGQGYNQYTVIQLANYVATIANNGQRYKPYVVEKILDAEENLVQEFFPELVMTSSLLPEIIEETQKAMITTSAPGGTAYSLFRNFPEQIKVAAKTGTAQPGRAGYVKNKDFDGLFIAYAPADDPQIAFAGVMEYGNSGSGSIGHVCKAVFEEYFGLNEMGGTGTFHLPQSANETSPTNAGQPSTSESEPPVNENQSPVDEEQPPANEGERPVDEGQPPVNEEQSPTNENEPAVNEGEFPTNEAEAQLPE